MTAKSDVIKIKDDLRFGDADCWFNINEMFSFSMKGFFKIITYCCCMCESNSLNDHIHTYNFCQQTGHSLLNQFLLYSIQLKSSDFN